MDKMYFKADLLGLINKLSIYSNVEAAKHFIIDVDFYSLTKNRETLNNIIVYLINCNRIKIINDTSISPKDKKRLVYEYNEYIMSLFYEKNSKPKLK